MWIGICDDNRLHSGNIEAIVLKYCKKFLNLSVEIEVFDSAESLLKEIMNPSVSFQILFLDIEMQGMNGIDAAREIRKIDPNVLIIYVTSYDQYTLESFEVKPFRYLLKPINNEKLTLALFQAIDEVMNNNQYLFYKQQNMQCQINCDKIAVILSESGRMISVKTSNLNESIIFYGKIKEIEKMLNPLRFIKVNPGTIVHLNYVNIITGSEVYLTTGQVFSISRGQKKIVKEHYNNFISTRIGVNL